MSENYSDLVIRKPVKNLRSRPKVEDVLCNGDFLDPVITHHILRKTLVKRVEQCAECNRLFLIKTAKEGK